MKLKTFVFSLGIFLVSFNAVQAQEFPKCKEACGKYYSCALEVNPNATEEQKQMLQKGCNFNCNRPKYYSKIADCLTTSGATCQSFSACITAQMQAISKK